MNEEMTKEPQYQRCIELRDKNNLTRLGLMSNQVWHDDPKRLLFLLSRYKFVAKMLSGMHNVLEVGCADAFGTRIVVQEVSHLIAMDFDPVFIKDAIERMDECWKFDCKVHDIIEKPVDGTFDGAYALDVLEHISSNKEEIFISNVASSLSDNGIFIIGTPSIQSQIYASPQSKEGHINCKDHQELKNLMLRFFHNVIIFSMNDEVVHNGFYPMSHYLLALCTGAR